MDRERALDYEYLIRAVFKCGRGTKHGANADIYRVMYHLSMYKGDEYKLEQSIDKVANHLRDALLEVQLEYSNNKEFAKEIEDCKKYLFNPTIESINICIDSAWEAFKKIGLKVG